MSLLSVVEAADFTSRPSCKFLFHLDNYPLDILIILIGHLATPLYTYKTLCACFELLSKLCVLSNLQRIHTKVFQTLFIHREHLSISQNEHFVSSQIEVERFLVSLIINANPLSKGPLTTQFCTNFTKLYVFLLQFSKVCTTLWF